MRSRLPRSILFDSIGSKDWNEQEQLVFITKLKSAPDEAFLPNFTIGTIESVIHSEHYGFHKTVPCDSFIMPYLGYNELNGDVNCTFSIALYADPVLNTITYNQGYHIYNNRSLCRSAILSPWECRQMSHVPQQSTIQTTNSFVTTPTEYDVTEATTNVDPSSVGEGCRLIFTIDYAHTMRHRSIVNCDYEIIHNDSIPLRLCS